LRGNHRALHYVRLRKKGISRKKYSHRDSGPNEEMVGFRTKASGGASPPSFPVDLDDFGEVHAAFLNESRTRSPR
jgi:hypothetical protein